MLKTGLRNRLPRAKPKINPGLFKKRDSNLPEPLPEVKEENDIEANAVIETAPTAVNNKESEPDVLIQESSISPDPEPANKTVSETVKRQRQPSREETSDPVEDLRACPTPSLSGDQHERISKYPNLTHILNSPKKRPFRKEVIEKPRRRFINPACPPPRSEMKMMDLIYFNPLTSPMKSSRVENATSHTPSSYIVVREVPQEPEREDLVEPKDEDSDQQMAPKVVLNEHGEMIVDESSLVIRRRKFSVDMNAEPIVEDDHITYSSFRKRRSKQWSRKETVKFYRALSLVGTDFGLMETIFQNQRTRKELKLKFKREEKMDLQLIQKIMYEQQTFDESIFELSDEEEETAESIPAKRATKRSVRQKKTVDQKQEADKSLKDYMKRTSVSRMVAEGIEDDEPLVVNKPRRRYVKRKPRGNKDPPGNNDSEPVSDIPQATNGDTSLNSDMEEVIVRIQRGPGVLDAHCNRSCAEQVDHEEPAVPNSHEVEGGMDGVSLDKNFVAAQETPKEEKTMAEAIREACQATSAEELSDVIRFLDSEEYSKAVAYSVAEDHSEERPCIVKGRLLTSDESNNILLLAPPNVFKSVGRSSNKEASHAVLADTAQVLIKEEPEEKQPETLPVAASAENVLNCDISEVVSNVEVTTSVEPRPKMRRKMKIQPTIPGRKKDYSRKRRLYSDLEAPVNSSTPSYTNFTPILEAPPPQSRFDLSVHVSRDTKSDVLTLSMNPTHKSMMESSRSTRPVNSLFLTAMSTAVSSHAVKVPSRTLDVVKSKTVGGSSLDVPCVTPDRPSGIRNGSFVSSMSNVKTASVSMAITPDRSRLFFAKSPSNENTLHLFALNQESCGDVSDFKMTDALNKANVTLPKFDFSKLKLANENL